MGYTSKAKSVTSFNMRTVKSLIEALVIICALVAGMVVILGLRQPDEPKQLAWEPYRPVEVSPPMDTSLYTEWEDNFDTSFVDDWGIKYVTRKEYVQTR